jgi:hypothetical protein
MFRNRKHLLLLITCLLLALFVLAPAWAMWQAMRQERMNQGLIAAIKRNDAKAVLTLLTAGADANVRDGSDNPISLWKWLLNHLRHKHPDGTTASTALFLAAHTEHEDVAIVDALLRHRADPNAKTDGCTPLGPAQGNDRPDMMRLLFRYGADANAKNRDDGHTQLMWAAAFRGTDEIALFLDYGADVNAQDEEGWTALMCAAERGWIDNVKFLLDRHADINRRDRQNLTVLSRVKARPVTPNHTTEEEWQEIIKLLQRYGAKE